MKPEKKERTFNLFLYINDGLIRELGCVEHWLPGSDRDKMRALQSRVHTDHVKARRFAVPKEFICNINGKLTPGVISFDTYSLLPGTGKQQQLWEAVLEPLKAPMHPLMVVTCIVDGAVMIEGVTDKMPS